MSQIKFDWTINVTTLLSVAVLAAPLAIFAFEREREFAIVKETVQRHTRLFEEMSKNQTIGYRNLEVLTALFNEHQQSERRRP